MRARSTVPYRPAAFLEPLANFVLEGLPWTLSGLIGLYLLWGFWSAPPPSVVGVRPLAHHVAPPPGPGTGIAEPVLPARLRG